MGTYRKATGSADEALSLELTRRCFAARACLLAEMQRLGLLAEDGWRVAETTRFVEGRSEIVFWPVHSQRPSPGGVECVAAIDEGE